MSLAGALLDTQGVRLPSGFTVSGVASNGTDFMVVGFSTSQVATVRVSGAGMLVDSAWSPVGTSSFAFERPTIASDGTGYLVVWGDVGAARDVVGRLVNAANVPVGPEFNLVRGTAANLAATQLRATVTYGGGVYLATWIDTRTGGQYALWGALVTPAGLVVGDVNFAIRATGTTSANPAPAAFNSGASEFLVVWVGNSDIEGQRVALTGSTSGPRLTLSAPGGSTLASPSVASDGTDWYTTWSHQTGGTPDVAGVRVTGAGAVQANDAITSGSWGETEPRIAVLGGGSYLLTWTDTRSGTSDIFANRLSGLGARLDAADLLVSRGYNSQGSPQVAFDGTNWLVVWADQRAGQSDILGMRFDQSGNRLDATPISIAATPNVETAPDVTHDQSGYLVVWEDNGAPCFFVPCASTSDVLGRRVTQAGATPSPAFVVSNAASSQFRPRAASAGASSLVVWADARQASTSSIDIFGARISGTTVLDPGGLAINTAAGIQETPEVASNGVQFFVVWSDQRPGGNSSNKIYGTRVQTNGTVNSPTGTLVSDVVQRVPFGPSVASNGLDALIGWTSVTVSGDVMYGRLMSSTGTVMGAADTVLVSRAREIALTYDAPNYFAAFRDERADINGDIGAGRWSTALAPLDGTGFTVTASAEPQQVPALAAGTQGRVLVVYSTVDPALFTPRVKVRRISRLADGAVCTSAGDCQSGFCVDGVCCASACGGGATGDCQACSIAAGAAVDGTCGPRSAGTVCRAASGVCDAPETCNGTGVACPGDLFSPSTTVCRPATSVCDAEERCTGTSAACPADGFASSSTVCRAAADVCDAVERCTGTSALCPADVKLGSSTVCRSANGACDIAERCGTAGDACPPDGVRPAGFTCRSSGGACDVAETCDGVTSACPGDGFAASGVTCRPAVGECDVAETCSGASASCPVDLPAADGTVCSLGVCGAGVCFSLDGGLPDAGVDGGGADAGSGDGGLPDAGVDGGGADAGALDGGDTDGGSSGEPDAGAQDGGGSDAGLQDAGALVPDGGDEDAGNASDGGPLPTSDAGQMGADGGTEPTAAGGCGCSQVDATSFLWGLALLLRRRQGNLRAGDGSRALEGRGTGAPP
ncbi:MAG: hypothetical protein AB1938_21710 [Myxococcota bacterium]